MTNTFVSLALILSISATAMILLRAFIDVTTRRFAEDDDS